MAAIKHKKVTGRPISVADWDDNHVLTGTPGTVLGFGVDGNVIEIPVEDLDTGGGTPPVDTTAPTITSPNPSGSYAEGAPVSGTLIANETVTFGKTGTDAGIVILNTATGAWSLPTTDYETKTSYSWQFTATDGATNVGTQNVSITITDVAEGGSTPTFPSTVNTSLPLFTITPETTTNPTTFVLGEMQLLAANDVMWVESATDDAFSANLVRHHHVITNAELVAGPPYNFSFDPLFSTLTGGTRRYRAVLQRGTERSSYGPLIRVGPNDVAPVLSNFATSGLGSTVATVSVDTTWPDGTLYHLRTASGADPSSATIISTGTAQVISSSGTKSFNLTGLTASTGYQSSFVHVPAEGPTSAVIRGSFTTNAPVVSSGWDTPPGSITRSGDKRTATLNTGGYPRIYGEQARSTGKYWVEQTVNIVSNGGQAVPGLIDTGTNEFIWYVPDSTAGSGNGSWTGTWNGAGVTTAVVRYEVDFAAKTIQAFLNGVSAGTKSFPGTATTLKPFNELGGVVGANTVINTGQDTPMGTVTSGFLPWG